MYYLVIISIAAVIIGLLIVLNMNLLLGRSDVADYERRCNLFTPVERSFLGVLEQALDSRYRVFGKVRLGDLIKPADDRTAGKRMAALNRINQNFVDFVVFTANELALVGVITLEDPSHGHEDRAGRGGFVDQSLAAAGIPVLRFPAKTGYQVQEVRARLAELLHPNTGAVYKAVGEGARNPALDAIMESHPVQPDSDATTCPSCSAAMVKRQVVTGQNAGGYFWACSTFPMCTQVVKIG
jgi:Protein of unknown function (DUF2726)